MNKKISIGIENFSLSFPVGFYPEERKVKSLFEISIVAQLDAQEFGKTDQFLNYEDFVNLLNQYKNQEFELIEQFALNLEAELLKKIPLRIDKLYIKIIKKHLPMQGASQCQSLIVFENDYS